MSDLRRSTDVSAPSGWEVLRSERQFPSCPWKTTAMRSDVYEAHAKAFAAVSAYVILKDGERVATVALKHGARVTAFVHWIGTEMVKGFANGGGYDRASAAVSSALHKAQLSKHALLFAEPGSSMEAFALAQVKDDGRDWTRRFEDAGFVVLQAV